MLGASQGARIAQPPPGTVRILEHVGVPPCYLASIPCSPSMRQCLLDGMAPGRWEHLYYSGFMRVTVRQRNSGRNTAGHAQCWHDRQPPRKSAPHKMVFFPQKALCIGMLTHLSLIDAWCTYSATVAASTDIGSWHAGTCIVAPKLGRPAVSVHRTVILPESNRLPAS